MKVLFVCTGNTCRSPMAEGIFNQLAEGSGHRALSCGVMVRDGAPASKEAILAAAAYGADLSSHRSRKITRELVEDTDLILTMTDLHKSYVLSEFPDVADKLYGIGEFSQTSEGVPDPFGGDVRLYELCAAQIHKMLVKIVEKLEQVQQ